MSTSSFESFRDGMHRMATDVYSEMSSQFKDAIKIFVGKTVNQTIVFTEADGTPRSRRSIAEAKFDALYEVLEKEVSTIVEVHERFLNSLGKVITCDITEVGANLSSLSEADCRRALPLACTMLNQMTKLAGIQSAIRRAFEESDECQHTQLLRWEAEACAHAHEVERLRAENNAMEKRMKQLTSSVNTCAKRLAALASASKKAKKANPLNEADALSAAISIAEKTIKAEQDRTKTLERELASAAEQLGAMRSAYDEASSRAQHLESELSVALGRGTTLATQCEELDEKLRCSTCMDRQKNVAFACGHAYCDECAAEWNTCSYSCKRPNSDKPVKFRYPLFL